MEPGLVDSVLDEVVAGRVDLGQTGRGVVAGAPTDDRIEAPYLQLVMRRLWEAEEEAGSHTLRTSTLVALGGAEEIVRAHLARALEPLTGEQKDIAAAVFNHLVTPVGDEDRSCCPGSRPLCGRARDRARARGGQAGPGAHPPSCCCKRRRPSL